MRGSPRQQHAEAETATKRLLAAAGILLCEHLVQAARGRTGIPMAFFTLNGIVSLALGLAGVAELLP